MVGCGGAARVDARAQKYDVAGSCWDEPLVVGSISAGAACDDALQVAFNDGECFLFPSGCVPAGFQALSPGDPKCPPVTAPSCSSARE